MNIWHLSWKENVWFYEEPTWWIYTTFHSFFSHNWQTKKNDFIKNDLTGLSIYSLHCKCLRDYSLDILDTILQNSKLFIFSEIWDYENKYTNIPNSNFIIKYKRSNVRSGGVAFFHHNDSIVYCGYCHFIDWNNNRSIRTI